MEGTGWTNTMERREVTFRMSDQSQRIFNFLESDIISAIVFDSSYFLRISSIMI